jgi:hypothetical protein
LNVEANETWGQAMEALEKVGGLVSWVRAPLFQTLKAPSLATLIELEMALGALGFQAVVNEREFEVRGELLLTMESTSGVLSLIGDIGFDGNNVLKGVETERGVVGNRVTGGGGERNGSTGKSWSIAAAIRSTCSSGGASLTLVKAV